MPIEVKSGKDYTIHSALSRLLADPKYGIKAGWCYPTAYIRNFAWQNQSALPCRDTSGSTPLDLTGRIRGGGISVFIIKF